HHSAKARRAFAKRQKAKLKRLQRAAARACRTPGGTPQPPPAPPPPPPPPANPDRDGDGTPNEQDCAPDNAAIHPGAPDLPDLAFVDSNCDGIDGTEAKAIFVSASGSDGNPGTKAAPVREISTAMSLAFPDKD